jgi:phenylalanyl-tRNA synthetase beta chain
LEKYGIEQKVTVFNLEVDALIAEIIEKRIFVVPITKYPAVTRDLAIIVPDKVKTADVEEEIRKQGSEWLKGIRLFDLYKGKQIDEGSKSLAFSLTWQAPDRTMTDEEVNNLHQKIEEALNREFGAGLRR